MALGLFLVGVPVCLVNVVGNPLPAGVPEWSSVVAAIESGSLPAGAVSGVLAIAVWIWWSQAALSFAAEVRAACRGRTARLLPLRGLGMQPVMVRLVAVVVAAAGTVGAMAQPVLAGTPSFADIAVPMDDGGTAGGRAGEMSAYVPAAAGMSSPAPIAGSLPAPILGLPEVGGADRGPAAPAPILGTPAGPPAQSSVPPAQSPVPSAQSWVSPAQSPVPSAQSWVPSAQSWVPPAQSPVPPARSVDTATRARWDPVIAPGAAPPAGQPAAVEPGEPAWVVVRPGDSLWLLAERHLGDALRWPDIFELNAGQLEGGGTLRDPNLIHPGWRLRLPPVGSPDGPDHPDRPGSAGAAAEGAARTPADPAQPVAG